MVNAMTEHRDDRAQAAGIEELHLPEVEDHPMRGALCHVAHAFLELQRAGGVDPVFLDRYGKHALYGGWFEFHGCPFARSGQPRDEGLATRNRQFIWNCSG